MPEEPHVPAETADPSDHIPVGAIPPREEPRAPVSPEELELNHRHVLLAASVASGMKAEDIRILDMHQVVTYTDFLLICTGRSTRQTRRIAEEIAFKLKTELALAPRHVEGQVAGSTGEGGEWILMDYLDFVVHVFTPEAREFYRLDHLWKEAPSEVIE